MDARTNPVDGGDRRGADPAGPPRGRAFWCERRLFPERTERRRGEPLGHVAIAVYLALCAYAGEPYSGPQAGLTSLALLADLLHCGPARCWEALVRLQKQRWITVQCSEAGAEASPHPEDWFAFRLLDPSGCAERRPGNQFFRLDRRVFDRGGELRTSGIATLAYISRRCGRNGTAQFSRKSLAGAIGVTLRHVPAIVRRLCAAGVIAVQPGNDQRRGVPEACTQYQVRPMPERSVPEAG